MDELTLRDQARRAAEGDQEAVDALLRGVHPHLYAFLYLLGFAEADIDDVAQDTALMLCRSLSRYDTTQPFLPWMRGIARNCAAMFRRREGRRARREDTWRSHLVDLVEAHEPVWDVERLRACISKLEERARAIIRNHYEEGRTSAEVAQLLGMSAVAVRKSLMAIRLHLRQCEEQSRA
ncbi:MAG: sigma-70 family RNA polymerase sigma factor [Planctomycetes bacterium]|nr:sigma-70 family RNA polymerase sigma factor [Planctomycetota bacterium]